MTSCLGLQRTIGILLVLCLLATGCRTASRGRAAEARWSFVKFNLLAPLGAQTALNSVCGDERCDPACDSADEATQCDSACDAVAACSANQDLNKALLLMAKSTAELDQLMHCHSAPDIAEIEGPWKGINKGVATALLGLTQDTKVFQACAGGCDQVGRGYNIQVQQVSLCDLDRLGFRPHIDRHTGRATTMGNFIVRPAATGRAPLILDYTAADNPRLDPSRRLVDELVLIEPNLLLGRAHIQLGTWRVPIAYFVLYRD